MAGVRPLRVFQDRPLGMRPPDKVELIPLLPPLLLLLLLLLLPIVVTVV